MPSLTPVGSPPSVLSLSSSAGSASKISSPLLHMSLAASEALSGLMLCFIFFCTTLCLSQVRWSGKKEKSHPSVSCAICEFISLSVPRSLANVTLLLRTNFEWFVPRCTRPDAGHASEPGQSQMSCRSLLAPSGAPHCTSVHHDAREIVLIWEWIVKMTCWPWRRTRGWQIKRLSCW